MIMYVLYVYGSMQCICIRMCKYVQMYVHVYVYMCEVDKFFFFVVQRFLGKESKEAELMESSALIGEDIET